MMSAKYHGEKMRRGVAVGCLLLLLVPSSCSNHSGSRSVSERIRTSCDQLTASDEESRLRAESELLELVKSHPAEVAAEYDRQSERLSAFRGLLIQEGAWHGNRTLTREVMPIRSKAIACLNEMLKRDPRSSISWVYKALATVARNGHQVPLEFSETALTILATPHIGEVNEWCCIRFLSEMAAFDSLSRLAIKEMVVAPDDGDGKMGIGDTALMCLADSQLPGLADFLASAYLKLDGANKWDPRRSIILDEIARLQAKESLPWVLKAASDPRHDKDERFKATLCAALLGDEGSIQTVLEPIHSGSRIYPTQLSAIFEVLAQTGNKEHIAFIREKGLQPGKEDSDAIKALVKLDAIGKDELLQIFGQYCNKDSSKDAEEDWLIVWGCLNGLAKYVEDMTSEELAAVIDKPHFVGMKKYAAEAIASKGTSKGVEFLASVMERGPEENRVAAAHGLAKGFLDKYKALVLGVARQGVLSKDDQVRGDSLLLLADVAEKKETLSAAMQGICSNNERVKNASLWLLVRAAEKRDIWEVSELLNGPDSDAETRACAAAIIIGLTADADMPEEVPR